jgi:glycosyltransferase involved in cell wall biosynthesis
MLERCVCSVLLAHPSAALDVHVTVVCNACSDDSDAVVHRLQAAYPGRVSLVTEHRKGKSKALNAGILATTGDLVGMIDDDEEVDGRWLQVAGEAFQDAATDFIGGPYVPIWATTPPDWLPPEYLAVLGVADNGSLSRPYGRDFPGILKGGNAIIRRATLYKAGPYADHLGPGSFARLLSCEDEDMYWRLIEIGARGQYLPDLVIFHYIAEARLSREYYRKWCFWRGVSRGLMDRRHPLPVPYLAGVPRFLWGRAARGLLRLATESTRRAAPENFADELRMWDLAGFLYGRHVYSLARFSPIQSRRRGGVVTFPSTVANAVEDDQDEVLARQ